MTADVLGGPDLARSRAEVADLLSRVRYKDGWRFEIFGTCLLVSIQTPDSRTGAPVTVSHAIPLPQIVPPPRLGGWKRWLLEQIFNIERHEAMEFFLVDGAAPYFPNHQGNPYAVVEREVPVKVDRPEPAFATEVHLSSLGDYKR